MLLWDRYLPSFKRLVSEDISQTLPGRSSMGPFLEMCFLELSNVEKFINISWIRRGVIPSAPHTLDEINDSVVKPERGYFVRGSDPPLVYSAHSTADMWWGSIRLLLKTHSVAGM